ncbi:MAG: 16S rRNA (guanine(966)-N(2))-methyltransferase RsmD [Porticoccus sp.]|nr:16S rRNA (guanine(966)-N(2))-methyltransferase RsmD [Porticoccus sp.]
MKTRTKHSTNSPIKKSTPSQIRVIGGRWRGQKLSFVPIEGLRPTGDRIRETLFNWLAPVIHNAHCLDLFAGSGALGFEALSRGAQSTTFIELDPSAIALLQQNETHLKTEHANIVGANAIDWLKTTKPPQPFDVVFLDPPFAANLFQSCCDLLQQERFLANNAYIYIEMDSQQQAPITPDSWLLLKEKTTGQVTYRLYHTD